MLFLVILLVMSFLYYSSVGIRVLLIAWGAMIGLIILAPLLGLGILVTLPLGIGILAYVYYEANS